MMGINMRDINASRMPSRNLMIYLHEWLTWDEMEPEELGLVLPLVMPLTPNPPTYNSLQY